MLLMLCACIVVCHLKILELQSKMLFYSQNYCSVFMLLILNTTKASLVRVDKIINEFANYVLKTQGKSEKIQGQSGKIQEQREKARIE